MAVYHRHHFRRTFSYVQPSGWLVCWKRGHTIRGGGHFSEWHALLLYFQRAHTWNGHCVHVRKFPCGCGKRNKSVCHRWSVRFTFRFHLIHYLPCGRRNALVYRWIFAARDHHSRPSVKSILTIFAFASSRLTVWQTNDFSNASKLHKQTLTAYSSDLLVFCSFLCALCYRAVPNRTEYLDGTANRCLRNATFCCSIAGKVCLSRAVDLSVFNQDSDKASKSFQPKPKPQETQIHIFIHARICSSIPKMRVSRCLQAAFPLSLFPISLSFQVFHSH